jgi:DNA primase
MPLPKVSYEDEAREQRRKTLHDVVELAAKFFEAMLASRAGARARGYLADRGLDPATQVKFRLGYAPPERFALKEHLGKEGVPVEDMVAAGLLISGDDIPVPFDRFRDRVIFPISDLRGRVIAFGGRTLEKDAQPKYLNSPETPLFHKGATLYNIANARAAAHKGAPVIAVEGYVDVIALDTAGFEATVAPLGTALTAEQLGLMWKMADEPVLCFDGDAAGRRAAYRAVDIALPLLKPGKSLKFAALPEGNDPDDLVRTGGREAAADLIGSARPLADMLWMRETETSPLDTPERRAALEARLGEVTATIGDDTVRKYYRQDFGIRLRNLLAPAGPSSQGAPGARRPSGGRDWSRGRSWSDRKPAERGRFARRPLSSSFVSGTPYVVASPQLAASSLHRGHRSVIPRREALILQAALNHPWLLHDHLEDLSSIEFRHPDAEKLKLALIDIAAHEDHGGDSAKDSAMDSTMGGDAVREEIARRGFAELVVRIERAITTVSVWGARPEAGPEDVVMTWTQLVALHRQWHSLLRELKDAEQALGRETTDANYSWLQDVKARMAVIDGTEAIIEGFGAASGRPAQTL